MDQGQAQAAAAGVTPAPALTPVESIQAMLLAEDKAAETPKEEVKSETPAEATPEKAAEPEQKAEEQPKTDESTTEIPLEELEAIPLEVTVKGDNGEDVIEKLPIKELKLGYMRQKDYSRKTAEVARQRDEADVKIRQGVESERKAYQEQLQLVQQLVVEAVAPELKDVNWNHLASTDPAEYVRLKNRADQITNTLSQVQSKQTELTQKQQAEQAQARQKAASDARVVLERDIPEWSDTHYQKLMKFAVDNYGYKPEAVAQWIDPGAFKALNDAYQFRQLKSEAPVKEKKVVRVPQNVRPGAKDTSAAQRQNGEVMSRLQKSGRIEDAAAVIKSRMS